MRRLNRTWVPVAAALLTAGTGAAAEPAAATAPAPAFEPPPPPAQAPELGGALKVLTDQARYWFGKDDPLRASEALDRALRLDPEDPDALALQVQMLAAKGDRAAARAALSRLRAVRPDDPRAQALEAGLLAGPVDPAAVADARRLAAQGELSQAAAAYRTLFRGGVPPAEYALEYWQVLAGTEDGWDQARRGLADLVRAHPQDLHTQLAYAEALTYRETTRAGGIARLAALAQEPGGADAARAWHRALEWLPQDAASVPAYQAWLAQHPDDSAIAGGLPPPAMRRRHPPMRLGANVAPGSPR